MQVNDGVAEIEISIHALREEGDAVILVKRHFRDNFYPRPPRGGRPHRGRSVRPGIRISIHALREEGDLGVVGSRPGEKMISIHALREEGDGAVHDNQRAHQ